MELCVGNELWARQGRDVLDRSQLRMPSHFMLLRRAAQISCFYETHGYASPEELSGMGQGPWPRKRQSSQYGFT